MRALFAILCVVCALFGCSAHPGESGMDAAGLSAEPPPGDLGQRPLDPVATRLRNHPIVVDAVRSVAFSPDGATLAAGTGTGEIQLWDVTNAKLLHRWDAHGHWTFDVEFHPDGTQLLSAGGDGVVRLWSIADQSLFRELVGHTDDVHGAALVPESDPINLILSGSDDGSVRLWSLDDASHAILGRHDKQVTAAASSPDGNWGASSSRDGTVRLWNLSKRESEPAAVLRGHEGDVLSVAFDRQGKRLVTASYDHTIGVWDVASHRRLHTITGHSAWVFTAIWGFRDEEIYSGSGDRTLRHWQLEASGAKLVENFDMDSDVSDLTLHPATSTLAAGLADGAIMLFKEADGKLKVERQLLAPPREAAPPAAPADLRVSQKWVEWHLDAANPAKPEWDYAVAQLGDVGTAWTRQYLAALDRSRMSPAQTDLLDRVLLRLERHSESLSPATVRRWLERAAWCDLSCNAMEASLVSCTMQHVRNAAADDELGEALRQLAESYKPIGGEPDAMLFDSFEQRVRLYAADALTANSGK